MLILQIWGMLFMWMLNSIVIVLIIISIILWVALLPCFFRPESKDLTKEEWKWGIKQK